MADRYLAENNDILQLEDASGYYLIDKDAIRLSESSNIAASAATSTTQRLTGGTGSFTAGRISDDTNPLPSIDIGADGNTELEFSVVIDDTLTNGDQYELRITDNGTALGSYTATAQLTVGTPPTPSLPPMQNLFARMPALRMR